MPGLWYLPARPLGRPGFHVSGSGIMMHGPAPAWTVRTAPSLHRMADYHSPRAAIFVEGTAMATYGYVKRPLDSAEWTALGG